jgi:hypothetical protein
MSTGVSDLPAPTLRIYDLFRMALKKRHVSDHIFVTSTEQLYFTALYCTVLYCTIVTVLYNIKLLLKRNARPVQAEQRFGPSHVDRLLRPDAEVGVVEWRQRLKEPQVAAMIRQTLNG